MKVNLSQEQQDLFKNFGSVVNTAEGNTYRYLPFWYKETDVKDVFEIISLEKVPDDLKDAIKDTRTC